MFPNLNAEMARQGLSQRDMALRLGWSPTKLSRKISGKSPLLWSDCKEILKALGDGLSADYVFARED